MNNRLASYITLLRGIRFKRRCWRKSRIPRQRLIKAIESDPIIVADGPFKGLRFLNEPVWGSITPKWLGSYEAPLWHLLESIFKRKPEVIIDVGCAEGYYAVGIAYRLPESIVYAFDADCGSMRQTRKLANLNNISHRVVVGNWCSHSDIERLTSVPHGLLFCDIEGGEEMLLDPRACPLLDKWDILVEVHPLRGSLDAMSELLVGRFSHSHDIQRIEDCARTLDDFPDLRRKFLDPELFHAAAAEGRPWQQHWLWMRSKLPG